MDKDTAKTIVAEKTACHTPTAFEFDGQWYALATPLSDYNPKNDVAQTWVRVGADGEVESLPGESLILEDMQHPGLCDAAKIAMGEL